MTAFTLAPARSPDDLAAVAALFRAYAAALPIDLGYQGFEAELAGLPGPYAAPRGALLLARGADGAPLGCVALRPIPPEGCCEMKRLYAAPAARGQGLGRALAQAIVAEGRRLGYDRMRLDSLSSLTAALGLYRAIGFVDIPPYSAPVLEGVVFMELDLRAAAP